MMATKTKTSLKRLGRFLLWTAVFAGFVVLLVAAGKEKNDAKCKDIKISFKAEKSKVFLETADIKALIIHNKRDNPVGKASREINILAIEKTVEKEPWVKDAEIYIDNNQVLHIDVTQREPVARVFTFNGNSFYFDPGGERIPASPKFSVKVPVFTNYPTDSQRKLSKADSTLTCQLIDIASYIVADTFWNAQVEQVNITPDREFEIIPKLGEHVIEFGEGTQVDNKFKKLLVFYKEALNKVGWNTYSRINIAYQNEVYAVKKDAKTALVPTDSTATPRVEEDPSMRVQGRPVVAGETNPPKRNPNNKTAGNKGRSQQPRAIYTGQH